MRLFIEEFREDIVLGFGALASLEDELMPELVCPNCGCKFEYKKLTTVRCQLRWPIYRSFF